MNRFLVGGQGNNKIVIVSLGAVMTKDDALNLAAWLVVLAEEEEGEFDKILAEAKES